MDDNISSETISVLDYTELGLHTREKEATASSSKLVDKNVQNTL